MKKIAIISILLFAFLLPNAAQKKVKPIKVKQDTTALLDTLVRPLIFEVDESEQIFFHSTNNDNQDNITTEIQIVDTLSLNYFRPDPMRSVWMGALIPGFGQIVNKKYYKLPIVYGGFMGFAYAINYNQNRYMAFKRGYIDITDSDPTTNYHLKLLPRGYTLESFPGGEATFKNRLKSGMDQFHRYRDLSLILTVGYYALVMLDAFVDAQLYDFDIKSDLAIQVTPTQFEVLPNKKSAYGLQCSIRF